ncbi:MAG: hypothetical protein AB1483_01825 [Candidatus Zixiibacteriota bacterium]
MIKRFMSLASGLLSLIAVAVCLTSCDSGVDPSGDIASIVDMPNNAVPADFSTGHPNTIKLYWSDCSRAEGSVTYALYFGNHETPGIIAGQLTDTFYVISGLEDNTTYYWRVEACGEEVCVKSPLWQFTTGDVWMYPLRLGQTWHYRHELRYSNLELDDDGYFIRITTYVDTIHVAVIDDDIVLDGYPGFVVYSSVSGAEAFSYSYLQNRDDGLYYYGGEGTLVFAVPWKASTSAGLGPGGIGVSIFEEVIGSISGEDDAQDIMSKPYLSLVYPLNEGTEWIVTRPEDNDAGWRIGKEVLAQGHAIVYAGTFDCFLIRRYYDRDGDGKWDDDILFYDYIGEQGLLKRTVTYYGISLVEGFEVIGTADITEELSLISYYRALPD